MKQAKVSFAFLFFIGAMFNIAIFLAQKTKASTPPPVETNISYEEKRFMDALGHRESSNNYQKVSKFGYLGRYQFGEVALEELGYYKKTKRRWGPKNHWEGIWSGKHGIHSKKDFLNNKIIQDIAAKALFIKNWKYIKNLGLHQFIGQKVQGVRITKSGLIAGVHLMGVGGLSKFLLNKTPVQDGMGTHISEYINNFKEYKLALNENHKLG